MKFRIAGLLVFSIILAACAPVQSVSVEPTPKPIMEQVTISEPQPTPTDVVQVVTLVSPTDTPVATATAPALEKQTLKDEGTDPKFTIELNYPMLAGADVFNQASLEIAERVANAFKENLKTYPPVDDPNLTSFSNVTMDYTVLQATPEVVSIYYQVSEYYRGAAHPAPSSAVLTYDLKNQKVLALADLFQPGADYLQALSDYAVKDLTGKEWFSFPEGAQPKEENFRNWNLTPEGLQITFDPYQVAPYAAGFIKVLVPYDVLKGIANPDGPLKEQN